MSSHKVKEVFEKIEEEKSFQRLSSEEKSFWKEYSRIYKNLEKSWPYRTLTRAIREFLNPKQGETWLDAGCGPAKMSSLIWKTSDRSVDKIIAGDIILSPAKERLDRINSEAPIELKHIDFSSPLNYPSNYFDGIVGNLVFSYIPEFDGQDGNQALYGVLEEMHRILKPGGEIIWSTPKKNVHFEWNFLASLPDMLNLWYYIKDRDISRLLQGWRILRHALEIQKKGREGTYHFLRRKELTIMLHEIEFKELEWKRVFTQQVWINRSKKAL